jgi:hypothetical protein
VLLTDKLGSSKRYQYSVRVESGLKSQSTAKERSNSKQQVIQLELLIILNRKGCSSYYLSIMKYD